MNDLDTLRPEVRSALGAMVRADVCRDSVPTDAFDTIRAELLRLAHDSAEHAAWRDINERARFDQQQRAEKAEAELAALKARIAEADCVKPFTSAGGTLIHCSDLLLGKRVRLVVEE